VNRSEYWLRSLIVAVVIIAFVVAVRVLKDHESRKEPIRLERFAP